MRAILTITMDFVDSTRESEYHIKDLLIQVADKLATEIARGFAIENYNANVETPVFYIKKDNKER